MCSLAGKRFFIQTLGCKSNQYESQAIREALEADGFTETPAVTEADLCIINTCSVTCRADASCRNLVRQIQRKNPEAFLILTGCAVDLNAPWVHEIEGIDLLIPNTKKHALASILKNTSSPEFTYTCLDTIPDDRLNLTISRFSERTRAFLKIQDGCDNYCSYCTIPYARGKPESRNPHDILNEARKLIDNGHKEIVFTGINIGQYKWQGNTALADVAHQVGNLPGLLRLRMGSIEPPYVTDTLLQSLAQTHTCCAHLHIPLQSGDDEILQKMNRHYSTGKFEETINRVRSVLDHPAITTDIIVGFPSETEINAANTRSFCISIGFSRSHIFTYSKRDGTPAAKWKSQASAAETKSRFQELLQITDKSANDFASSLVGMTETLLTEEYDNEDSVGYGERYLRIRVKGQKLPLRELTPVKVIATQNAELLATPI